jgi:outer membrane protein assembly factor BamB
MRLITPTLALLLICITVSLARAQDWPQWRGANRDGKSTGFNAPKTWPKELTKKWQVTVGDGDATPSLANGKLYVFARENGNEVARCLDAATGKELWQDKYETGAATGPASGHAGPRSSPTVADGKVVTLGVRGTLSCLDVATGKKLWRKDDFKGSWPKFFTSSSPLVTGGLCIAQLGGETDGVIAAYDLNTGDQKWKWSGDGTAYSSPILATVDGVKVILAETDKSLVAIGLADGKPLWQTPYAGRGMGGYNTATPIVDGQTVIYAGPGRGAKAVKLEKSGAEITAKELWSNPDNSVQFSTPVLKNGLIYALSGKDNFFSLDAKDGKTLWTAPGGGRRGFGSLVDAGSVVLALTPNAQLTVFAPGEKEFKQLASYKVAETDTYAYPVPSGNRIYIKDQNSVTLWTLGE